jgi:hypothetical protein
MVTEGICVFGNQAPGLRSFLRLLDGDARFSKITASVNRFTLLLAVGTLLSPYTKAV